MLTLSYGFFKPETGDKGSVFFPKLELNWQRVNDHNHDGSNSALVSSAALSRVTQAILAAAWAGTPGDYAQIVAYPAGVVKTTPVQIVDTVSNEIVYPKIVRGNTSMTIYSNDNTLAVTAIYG